MNRAASLVGILVLGLYTLSETAHANRTFRMERLRELARQENEVGRSAKRYMESLQAVEKPGTPLEREARLREAGAKYEALERMLEREVGRESSRSWIRDLVPEMRSQYQVLRDIDKEVRQETKRRESLFPDNWESARKDYNQRLFSFLESPEGKPLPTGGRGGSGGQGGQASGSGGGQAGGGQAGGGQGRVAVPAPMKKNVNDAYEAAVEVIKVAEKSENRTGVSEPGLTLKAFVEAATARGARAESAASAYTNAYRIRGQEGVRELESLLKEVPTEQVPATLEVQGRVLEQVAAGETMLLLSSQRFTKPEQAAKELRDKAQALRREAAAQKDPEKKNQFERQAVAAEAAAEVVAREGKTESWVATYQEALREAARNNPELKKLLEDLKALEQRILTEMRVGKNPALLQELLAKQQELLGKLNDSKFKVTYETSDGKGGRTKVTKSVKEVLEELRKRLGDKLAERLKERVEVLLYGPEKEDPEENARDKAARKRDRDDKAWQALCDCPQIIPFLKSVCPNKKAGTAKAGGASVGRAAGKTHNGSVSPGAAK